MARLFLVRHGESTWNAARRWQGQADPPLSDRGEEQAQSAAVTAATVAGFDVVVTSTLRRARRTGELLAAGLGVELGPALPSLAERSAGVWEGLTRAEIEERFPGYLASGRRPEGYEPDESILERAGEAMDDLVERHRGRNIIVVSHGGVINALERHEGEPWVRLDNLEGRWFHPHEDRVAPVGERIHLLATPNDDERAGEASGPGYA